MRFLPRMMEPCVCVDHHSFWCIPCTGSQWSEWSFSGDNHLCPPRRIEVGISRVWRWTPCWLSQGLCGGWTVRWRKRSTRFPKLESEMERLKAKAGVERSWGCLRLFWDMEQCERCATLLEEMVVVTSTRHTAHHLHGQAMWSCQFLLPSNSSIWAHSLGQERCRESLPGLQLVLLCFPWPGGRAVCVQEHVLALTGSYAEAWMRNRTKSVTKCLGFSTRQSDPTSYYEI